MAFDPDHGFVRISEGQIHYRRAGSADQRPLVMLHASPASSRSLLPLAAALPGRHLILPDTPGNGLSCAPAVASPNLATYAAMLDQAMDALGHRAIDLYGTHTGAHIAIEWAIAHPDRIGTLVLDGVALFSPELRAEFLAHYAPPQAIDASGRQFPWAWNMMRDQMIFWPHYKQDAAHLRACCTIWRWICSPTSKPIIRPMKPCFAMCRWTVCRWSPRRRCGCKAKAAP